MDVTREFAHFTIVHQLRSRLRIVVPSLCKDHERALVFEILLSKRQGITLIKIVPAIASVTICFDPQCLPLPNLLKLLNTVIANIGLKPRQTIKMIKHRANSGEKVKDFIIGIGGMSCASCALYLEMMLKREPEIVKASVNFLSETARVKGFISKDQIFSIISRHGYQPFSIDSVAERKLVLELEKKHFMIARKRLFAVAALGLPVIISGLLRSPSRVLIAFQAIATLPVIVGGGRNIYRRAWSHVKQGSANSDTLIAIGVGAAYGYSLPALWQENRHVYFDAAAGIIGFVLLGRYLDELAKQQVIGEIRKLVAMQPKEATLIVNDQEIKTNVERIVVNDVLLIRPGEKIPADGVVVKGLSSVDESMVNGSSKPEIKEEGHKVYEGSINGSGVLYVRATATGKDTLLAGQMHMVDQAHSSALQVQRTVDAVSSKFVPLVTVLSGLTFFGWLNRGESAAHALSNAIAVLLISCPCALGLATPAATMVGTGQAARRGIYIRNGKALETAVRIDTVVFDKTGTLTEGNAQVTDFLNISALDDESVIQLASSAEFNSEHFLAQALVRYGKLHGLSLLKSSRFYSLPDQGIRSTVGDHRLLLGTDSWLEAQNIDLTAVTATSKKWAAQGKTLVFMAIDQKAAALFAVTDTVKASAVSAIKNLHEKAIKSIMVTGDSEQAALPVARQLGITTVIANASPGKKLEIIRELQKQGHWIAMVGDGINDAPSLAAANLGMAVDKGTDIAIHAADLILVNSDINKVAETIAIGEETLVTIKQNLLWAFSYNAVAIPFAVFGRLSPTMASAAMALSSVSVLINSLSLTKRIDGR